jgi:hypothetical protein
MVFVDAPLSATGYMTDGEYPAGKDISGIPWKTEFTELQVQFTNDPDRVYEDLNIVIRPTEAIAAIKQITDVPGVSFAGKNDSAIHVVDVNFQSGASNAIPLVLLATDAGYRMRCPRLPGHSTLRAVIALAFQFQLSRRDSESIESGRDADIRASFCQPATTLTIKLYCFAQIVAINLG